MAFAVVAEGKNCQVCVAAADMTQPDVVPDNTEFTFLTSARSESINLAAAPNKSESSDTMPDGGKAPASTVGLDVTGEIPLLFAPYSSGPDDLGWLSALRAGDKETVMTDAVYTTADGQVTFAAATNKITQQDRETVIIAGSVTSDGTYTLIETGTEHVYELHPPPATDETFDASATVTQGGWRYLNPSMADIGTPLTGLLDISGATYNHATGELDFSTVAVADQPWGVLDQDQILIRGTVTTNGQFRLTSTGTDLLFTVSPPPTASETFGATARLCGDQLKIGGREKAIHVLKNQTDLQLREYYTGLNINKLEVSLALESEIGFKTTMDGRDYEVLENGDTHTGESVTVPAKYLPFTTGLDATEEGIDNAFKVNGIGQVSSCTIQSGSVSVTWTTEARKALMRYGTCGYSDKDLVVDGKLEVYKEGPDWNEWCKDSTPFSLQTVTTNRESLWYSIYTPYCTASTADDPLIQGTQIISVDYVAEYDADLESRVLVTRFREI